MAAPNAAIAPGQKKKSAVSAPMIYALLIVVGAAIYLNLPNQNAATPAKRRTTTATTTTSAADASGITAADYKAHFPRYPGGARNPYAPGILTASQQNASTSGLLGGADGIGGKAGGSWSLTGVSIINGVASALIESASGDSATLRKGDVWHGLKVTRVGSEAITFVNDLGQTTQLSFDSGASGNPNAPAVPSLSQIRPLAPLPVSAPAAAAPTVSPLPNVSSFGASFRARGRRGGNQANANQDSTNNDGGDGGGPPDGGGGPGGFGGPGGPGSGPPPGNGFGGPPD